MRAFVDVLRETNIPVQEAHWFIDAMEMDLCVRRYKTYDELRKYMRGSASAVGVMMTYAMGGPLEADTQERAKALGEAMQLTNFLRDVSEDLERDRVYLPLEDLDRFGVREEDLLDRRFKPQFRELMEFEIARARELYRYSDDGIAKLPEDMRKAVLLARILYSEILDCIEKQGCDVFAKRARTTRLHKINRALQVALLPKLLPARR
jgi:phytoene synthase